MSPRWPAALWVRSSALALSRPVHRDDLSRASPTRRSGFTSACSGVPACQHLSTSSPEHPRLDLETVPFASAALPVPPERPTRFERGTGGFDSPFFPRGAPSAPTI